MAEYLTTDTELDAIADAINAKGGTSGQLVYPSGFVSAIQAIPTGTTPTGTINISANGTYDVTNYASAAVAIPEYAGAHHSVIAGYTVTISLTNPRNPSHFGSAYVEELLGADPTVSGNVGNQLAYFSSATDSAEVTIASGLYGFVVGLSGDYVNPWSGQLICTGGVSGTSDNQGNLIFEVTGDGSATIDNIEWYDD